MRPTRLAATTTATIVVLAAILVLGTSDRLGAQETDVIGLPAGINLNNKNAPSWCRNVCRDHQLIYTGRWFPVPGSLSACLCKAPPGHTLKKPN